MLPMTTDKIIIERKYHISVKDVDDGEIILSTEPTPEMIVETARFYKGDDAEVITEDPIDFLTHYRLTRDN